MKLKPAHGFLILAVGFLLSLTASAQAEKVELELEESMKEARLDTDPDPVEPEPKSVTKAATPAKDSISHLKLFKPVVVPGKSIEKTQKAEEDPLSFNFLYYIIEKFKMSDMIE